MRLLVDFLKTLVYFCGVTFYLVRKYNGFFGLKTM